MIRMFDGFQRLITAHKNKEEVTGKTSIVSESLPYLFGASHYS
ncbi:hypothetical protein WCQ58_11085 [Staphylococcus pseudintermedius]|nr:hypothetical protein [Staphylococcus pseudintermedius]MDK4068777.1 hypothetical protein [Staphylococcus pseudintermedius]MDT0919781.1 hypothetical protein [Staphylococcus pseudintermedius]MDU9254373.1 hypothetical protein [Staphylococcus pseudintermedius]MDU9274057.1 hypothetical protein [Staphylococcus pseudintermedius]MDU9288306.1 hypothetical protein [Staphylococcus pseudintermedius]